MYDKVAQIYDWWETHGLGTNSETVINPTDYKIINAYPNPFNGAITIDLILSHGSNKIFIYDLLGHMQYKKEIQGYFPEEFSFHWQPDNNQASGIYFIKISNSQLENVKKITYLK